MAKATEAASTQKFTEIREIVEDIVIFNNGNACLVIEVSPTNFALLSKEEQDAKIISYASFLNSLSFPVEILAVNKRVDVTSYITLLEGEIKKITDQKVATYMENYKEFVLHLVKQNIVLDKRFFIIIPFSYLESAIGSAVSQTTTKASIDTIIATAKPTLKTKAEGLQNQLTRANLQTRILKRDQLMQLFHNFYHATIIQDIGTGTTTEAKA